MSPTRIPPNLLRVSLPPSSRASFAMPRPRLRLRPLRPKLMTTEKQGSNRRSRGIRGFCAKVWVCLCSRYLRIFGFLVHRSDGTHRHRNRTDSGRPCGCPPLRRTHSKRPHKLRVDFTLPAELDYYAPSTGDHDEVASVSSALSSGLTKVIPYTSIDKSVYKYEHELNRLMEEPDRTESRGDAEVRDKGKGVAKAIERILEEVECDVGEVIEKRLSFVAHYSRQRNFSRDSMSARVSSRRLSLLPPRSRLTLRLLPTTSRMLKSLRQLCQRRLSPSSWKNSHRLPKPSQSPIPLRFPTTQLPLTTLIRQRLNPPLRVQLQSWSNSLRLSLSQQNLGHQLIRR